MRKSGKVVAAQGRPRFRRESLLVIHVGGVRCDLGLREFADARAELAVFDTHELLLVSAGNVMIRESTVTAVASSDPSRRVGRRRRRHGRRHLREVRRGAGLLRS